MAIEKEIFDMACQLANKRWKSISIFKVDGSYYAIPAADSFGREFGTHVVTVEPCFYR
ncbi:hypothetical protein F7734_53445 [Scytonema sp. UIC 10036]|uniref:hypothetical protein n=1 Tax=Scytonema sp. UIC 10036 TaxID=2304196 RepID=UPI0012DA7C02|nr:hypothetical protein [Scytonema sp. UIC 10036]MUH00614.1 hypothetical protein [Scytonema sp. UIC 10036]